MENLENNEVIKNEKLDLSEEEKEKIDSLMAEYVKLTDDKTGFEREKGRDTLKKIATSMDHRSLYYLKESLFTLDTYEFSLLCEVLAKEEDLDFVLDLIKDERVICAVDRSAFGRFNDLLKTFARKIREKDPSDERLVKIVKSMIPLIGKGSSETWAIYNGGDISDLLAYTGTEDAEEFFKSIGQGWFSGRSRQYLDNVSACDLPRKSNPLLSSPQDTGVHTQNPGFYNNRSSSSTYIEDYDDYEYPDDFDSYYSDDSDPIVLDDETKKEVNQVDQIIEKEMLLFEKTIEPVSKLMLFNELRHSEGRDQESIARSLKRINELQECERLYLEIQEIPTIGIEVECDSKYLNGDLVALLNELKIPNYKENGGLLREVNPEFSYSPNVQARMLEELVKLGAIPKEIDESGKSSVNKNFLYSLHINLSVPEELDKEIDNDYAESNNSLYNLVDVTTFSFISPERVLNRKTSNSLFIKGADKSKKHKQEISFDLDSYPKRFEYRANEFRNYSSFRMIAEIQRLAAMLFSNLKVVHNKPVNELEKKLSDLWIQFSERFQVICDQYAVDEMDLADTDKHELSRLLKETDIQKDCRSLINEFSRKAMSEIKVVYGQNNKKTGA